MGSGVLERFGSHRILRIAGQLYIGHGKHIKSKVFIFTAKHIATKFIPSDTHYLYDVKMKLQIDK